MKDLAPTIYRQRAVIEGYPSRIITNSEIKDYLSKLSKVLDMTTVLEPITHRSDKYGEAGWIHWETSGAHFYAWEVPMLFFSVDIYTCKEFNIEDAVDFTREYFDTKEIVFKEF
jgi:S-adenosylmethionine decarboxylase